MYSATREHEVSFHQYEKDTTDRIRYQRVNERTGKEAGFDDIVKGTEVGDGKLVMLDQEELDSVAPGRSKSLDLHAFVDLEEIDPIYFQKSYYLGPRGEETAKTYALLRDAKEITVADPAPESTRVTDLMEALQASVERARKGRATTAGAKKAPAKAPAKKANAKKAAPAEEAPAKKPAAAKKATAKKTTGKKSTRTA